VILISPADEDALLPAYKAAAEAGIPMISIANRLNTKNKAWENAFFGMDLVKMGRIETEELIEAIGGSGKIMRIMGPSGIAFVRDSKAGMDQALADNPDVEVVFEQNAKAISADEGFRITQDALTANPDIKGVWAQEDEIATGVVRALQDRGVDIPVAWNGGTPAAMDLAADGKLVGVVLGSYEWGKSAVDGLHAAVSGEAELPFETESEFFALDGAEHAKELIAKCPENPKEGWCLGRK
jgi:ABC-type sugar transport system substrate-binding protein